MKHIGNLGYSEGAKKSKKRIGRGPGSGHGGTSTRGHKGQKAVSGGKIRVGFEGGQMPLVRRLPKFGFQNRFSKEFQIVNVGSIQQLINNNILTTEINAEVLYNIGVIKKLDIPVKILGDGELNSAINVKASAVSNSAKIKIESVGGTVTINE